MPGTQHIAENCKIEGSPTHFVIKNGVVKGKFFGTTKNLREEIQNSIDG